MNHLATNKKYLSILISLTLKLVILNDMDYDHNGNFEEKKALWLRIDRYPQVIMQILLVWDTSVALLSLLETLVSLKLGVLATEHLFM